MATTQLFVELLVIGIGVAAWLFLFAAATFGWRLDANSLSLAIGQVLPVTALAYVLGIIMDRIAREVFGRFLFRPDHVHGIPTADAERLICRESERLWTTCAYNRSRFRVCRAWTLNFALLALAYTAWNARAGAHAWPLTAVIIFVSLVLSLLAVWATVRLNRDYYVQIEGVFPLVVNGTSPRIPATPY